MSRGDNVDLAIGTQLVHEAIQLKSARERPRLSLQRLFGRLTEWLELAAVPIGAYPDLCTEKPWPCGLSTSFAVSGAFQIVALQLLGKLCISVSVRV